MRHDGCQEYWMSLIDRSMLIPLYFSYTRRFVWCLHVVCKQVQL